MEILKQTKKIADKFNGRSVYVEAKTLLGDFKDCEYMERCTEFPSRDMDAFPYSTLPKRLSI